MCWFESSSGHLVDFKSSDSKFQAGKPIRNFESETLDLNHAEVVKLVDTHVSGA